MNCILGIETSCDETAVAVVRNGRDILSNVVSSSLKEHAKYGGIIPEIASRRQMELIHRVTQSALNKAQITLNDIDALAVTVKPGLIGSLLVGISFARALAFAAKKPLLEIDHVKAHLYANFVSEKTPHLMPKLPAVGLVVSGGHSSLYYLRNFNSCTLIGQTRDDAAGEAFDKVAKILNLGYPGGPAIDKIAGKTPSTSIRFKCADLPKTFDFSFSGIKTAVLYFYRDPKNKNVPAGEIAKAFQDSVVSTLAEKSIAACVKKKAKTLLVGGGVAANSALRERLAEKAKEEGIQVFFPPIQLCIDNAAMIAGLGYHERNLN